MIIINDNQTYFQSLHYQSKDIPKCKKTKEQQFELIYMIINIENHTEYSRNILIQYLKMIILVISVAI